MHAIPYILHTFHAANLLLLASMLQALEGLLSGPVGRHDHNHVCTKEFVVIQIYVNLCSLLTFALYAYSS